jgi:hypothetical protein
MTIKPTAMNARIFLTADYADSADGLKCKKPFVHPFNPRNPRSKGIDFQTADYADGADNELLENHPKYPRYQRSKHSIFT